MNCYNNHFDVPGSGCWRGLPLSGTIRNLRRSKLGRWIVFFLLAAGLVNGVSVLAAGSGTIHQDAERKLVTLADGQGQLVLRLNYDGRCVLDQVIVRGREVAAESGVASGICQDGDRKSTRLNSSHVLRSRMPSSA